MHRWQNYTIYAVGKIIRWLNVEQTFEINFKTLNDYKMIENNLHNKLNLVLGKSFTTTIERATQN